MQKRLFFLVSMLLVLSLTAMAQVTTSSMSGKVTASDEEIIGATITARHVPSGAVYRAVSNATGRYAIDNMRAGGPYEVEVSYIGFQTKKFTDLQLKLSENTVLDVWLDESTELLKEVQVFSTGGRNNMRTDRAGSVTSVNAQEMQTIPTVSRSLNDIMKLTPTGANTGNGYAVGGGNFRQSYVTIDGAAFNNAFGLAAGGNLPGGGSPISIDALDQISVSTSPFDVRQSGFTGGAINAVTKSGTNEFKGSAYMYTTNVHLRGNKVADLEPVERTQDHSTTYGLTLGGPIIKDKLFFFVSGEYADNVKAGPTTRALKAGETYKPGENNRPTEAQMNTIKDYLAKTYGYNPGAYQDYSDEAPAYKLLARLDWNIDDNNKVNLRFSKSQTKDVSAPSSSVSPLTASVVYPGSTAAGIRSSMNLASDAAIYFQSQRYYKDYNFTSFAAEWNAKWGSVNNTLRATYSYQDDPRSYEGGTFPTTHILEDGAVYTAFGPDLFTAGNLARVKTFVGTDEVAFTVGLHKLTAGVQYESNEATNGFMQGGNGLFIYNSWDDFVNKATPAAYLITMSAAANGSQFLAKMKMQQLSFYLQDQINVSDRLRLTGGLRVEKPIYPALENNYNHQFAELIFDNNKYETDQLPDGSVTFSPRLGFNWDITGDQRFVLRGGTGYFVGRLPFVWLVSAVGNSNCGQIQYGYQNGVEPTAGIPTFSPDVQQQISTLDLSKMSGYNPSAPTQPTIIDRSLSMNAAWKTSLAIDAKLPYDIDFTLEGLYSRDYNPAVIRNVNMHQIGNTTVEIAPGDFRPQYTTYTKVNPYLITNAGSGAYYFSITASAAKHFDFGLDLKASYTYARAKSYGDGIGDQVTSAYNSNRYSVGAVNDEELGYGTYVSPNRLLITANYRKEYAKHFASTIGLVYDGMNSGFIGGSNYRYSRYSYVLNTNVIGDRGSNNLMYIPESRAALDKWNFTDIEEKDGVYTANQQRDDFWAFIQQDDYFKNHTGEYAERGAAIMPWHHQLDFRFLQDFYVKVGGKRNTLQLGVDIENLPNLLNKNWGLYQQVNTMMPLTYTAKSGTYNFSKQAGSVLKDTYSDYAYNRYASTYRIQFSVRYIFN